MAFSISHPAFVHPQLQNVVAKMSLFDRIVFYVVHLVDKFDLWHRLPVLLGLAYLGLRRHLHQRYNLLNVGKVNGRKYDTEEFSYRTADGTCNHPKDHLVGSQLTFFGRNMPQSTSGYGLLEPHPVTVAAKLLERRKYIDCGCQFNMIGCAWVQFMIHDWNDHMEDTEQVELRAPQDVAAGCPLKSFKDGSVIYGNNKEGMIRVRTFKDGKLRISGDGLLEHDGNGIPISGDVRNHWAGYSLLQALFVKEHNAICDMLKEHHPEFDDEKLYRHARLITSAVIAKIHTIDLSTALLKTDTLVAATRINWYGFLGKKVKDLLGPKFGPILSGLVGLKSPRDHGIPYSLTEEFVGVYVMHSFLPDTIVPRDLKSTESEDKSLLIQEETCQKSVWSEMMISMGHRSCGAVTLWNYPSWMRNLVPHDTDGDDRPDLVDMAALEIRRNLLMLPISKWEDLTDDEEVIEALQEVYGDDVEKLDLQALLSETAFFIFVLIASRRLEADRFFTTDFNSRTYTKKGFEWVNKTVTLKDVIDRHFPDMTKKYMRCTSAFSAWRSYPHPKRYLPLYPRLAT
ncbi:unnamed protein product [Withania somnifera]